MHLRHVYNRVSPILHGYIFLWNFQYPCIARHPAIWGQFSYQTELLLVHPEHQRTQAHGKRLERLLDHFVQQEQRHLSGSLEFLSRIVHAKNTWKSSATAKRNFLKGNFRFLEETAKDYLCQKLKT